MLEFIPVFRAAPTDNAAMTAPEAGRAAPAGSWDLFCAVVDHYGDIGVCWRLARQLAREHGRQVRLWVDDLDAFRRLNTAINPALDGQHCDGVEVRHWRTPFPDDIVPHETVIEAFGCSIPERYIAAMVRARPPVWINLEYLSAESWTRGCHGLPSPHPRLPLTKYFYFPGFVADSGGLLREDGLAAARDAFDVAAAGAFWRAAGVPAPAGELRVSLFCYERDTVTALLDAWTQGGTALSCIVPQGTAPLAMARFFGSAPAPGESRTRGDLTVHGVPFLQQDDYDRLLWACDLNFVRGEDSFVRAQWAGKPMAWQIYFQPDGAHWKKLQAFLDLYCAALPAPDAAGVRALWEAWNGAAPLGDAWRRYVELHGGLSAPALAWARQLMRQDDLALKLMQFAGEKR